MAVGVSAEIIMAMPDRTLRVFEYRPESDAAATVHPDHANVVEKVTFTRRRGASAPGAVVLLIGPDAAGRLR